MIVIRMSGGLGNQMFQYALYLKLRALGREVCFDDFTQYDEQAFANSVQKRRPKALNVFGITYPVVSHEDMIRMTDSAMDYGSRIRRKLHGRKSLEKDDQDFIYDPSFLETEEGYFCGGFQSAKYFAGVEDEVRRAFTFQVQFGENTGSPRDESEKAGYSGHRGKAAAVRNSRQGGGNESGENRPRWAQPAERILEAGEHSASVHLRFGDYIDKSDIYGGICTDAYYDEAIREILDEDPEAVFFVFSNDSAMAGDWVRVRAEREGNIGAHRFILITGQDEDHGWIDLYLMTLCRFHVIANSSFSWWGSWLSRWDNKRIFAPSIWNNEKDGSELRRTDIYTDDMIRINPQGVRMDDEPLVSVIVTAYNVGAYIRNAMDSVCGQTWKNLDIVAVDDGSTDDTGSILDSYAEKDARVRVFHTENSGVSAARNRGLDEARGEYIGFVDGDDRADPQMYEVMVRGILASGADMAAVNYAEKKPGPAGADTAPGVPVSTDAAAVGSAALKKGQAGAQAERAPSGKNSVVGSLLGESVLLTREGALQAFIRSSFQNDSGVSLHPAVWSKLFSRKVLENNRFPEGTSAEDIPFTTQALCRAGKVLYLPAALYEYTRERSSSIMNTNRAERTLREEIPAWHTHLAMLKTAGLDRLAEESEYYYYRRLLAYEEDYRGCPETRKEADELQERILAKKDRILSLTDKSQYGRRGDRERLRLYVHSPREYYAFTRLYAGTVVAWKNRRQ